MNRPVAAEPPPRVAKLPRNKAGYPVPWFAAWIDGQPDFRVIRAGGIPDALQLGLCWICGQPRGRYSTFVVGPMCTINRTSAEPPSHLDCATYAARTCPFLTTPTMARRDRNLPEGAVAPAGTMITRNPGVTAVWTTRRFTVFAVGDQPGVLFDIGDPESVTWFCSGRPATRREVLDSIDSGYPLLAESAREQGPGAVEKLHRLSEQAMRHLPRERGR